MLFNSIEYLFFFPVVFIIYWSFKRSLFVQNLLLLLASYFFYGLWDYRFLSLIIISSLADFLIGGALGRCRNTFHKKLYLSFSLLINLGFLGVFKYYNFFIDSFSDFVSLFGWSPGVSTLNIILPVGISFYTFQTLSYTIDIYRGNLTPSKSILNFFTYVAFFPQLVAGPIERAINLLPQIENERVFNYEQSKDGLRQILWGLFKKVVVADNCAIFVDTIFAGYSELSGFILLLGAFLFSFQIYCDFSGYSDIAIGTSKLLGIKLMKNFATPYFSRDIAEFWRRWHISLSTWFRDYLYIPLGGSRVNKYLRLRNIFAIFLVSGFWHGANWTFIFWGWLHSLFYIPQIFTKTNRNYLGTVAEGRFFPSFSDLYRMLRTFLIVTIAWVFFRSNSMLDSFAFLKRIFVTSSNELSTVLDDLSLELFDLYLVVCYIFCSLIIEWISREKEHGLEVVPGSFFFRYVLYVFLSLFILEYFYGQSSFIYFQF